MPTPDHTDHTPLLTPAQRLPTETLQHIFTYTYGVELLILTGDIKQTTQFRLSQVCRSWRGAALGLSEIWVNVRMERTARSKDRSLRIGIQRMELLLPRCKSLPLSLSVRDDHCGDTTIFSAPRRSTFDDHIGSFALEGCLLCLLRVQVYHNWARSSSLRTLSLSKAPQCKCRALDALGSLPAEIWVSPVVRSITIHNILLVDLHGSLEQLEQLVLYPVAHWHTRHTPTRTRFALPDSEGEEEPEMYTIGCLSLFSLLKRSSLLKHLSLEGEDFRQADLDPFSFAQIDAHTRGIHLPALESLKIIKPEVPCWWIAVLHAPHLRELVLEDGQLDDHEWVSDTLRANANGGVPFPQLEKLTLYRWTGPFLMLLLQGAPNLRALTIEEPVWSRLLPLASSRMQTGGRPLVANLEELVLIMLSPSGNSGLLIDATVAAPKLTRVVFLISYHDERPGTVVERLSDGGWTIRNASLLRESA